MDSVALFFIFGLPLLLLVALAVIATGLDHRLNSDYAVWVLAGALAGVPALPIAIDVLATLFRPIPGEFDSLATLFLLPAGVVLGAGTVLVIVLLRHNERTVARHVLALLLLSAIVPASALVGEFRLRHQPPDSTATTAYWLSVYGLPLLWLVALWLVWLLWPRGKAAVNG